MLNVFLSIESGAGTSLLSMYSTSGLLKDSQVEIVSSTERECSSDLLGETAMLHCAGRAVTVETGIRNVSSALRAGGFLLGTTTLDFTLEDRGKPLLEIAEVLFEVEDNFLALAILVTYGYAEHIRQLLY